MHLVETYALVSGSKISRPHTSLDYYPLPFDKYIVVHSGSENPSRIYDYFNDVIYHCMPVLEAAGIKVVQIGGPDDNLLDFVYDARGTSKRQMQYLIKNSLALMGNDTCSSHFASALGTKMVVLHSSLFPQNSRPYWTPEEDMVVIEADRGGNKPSFSFNENPKTMNSIKPELVARSLLNLLQLDHDCDGFETVYMGDIYSQLAFDVIPDVDFCLPKYAGCVINVRLDLVEGYNFLPSWFENADLNLIVRDNIDIEVLKKYKDKIFAINLDVRTKLTSDEVESIFSLGVPVNFFAKNCTDQEFSQFALKWFDYNIIRSTKKPIALDDNYDYFFTSRKMYVSSKGKFLTVGNYYANITSQENYQPIQNDEFFWDDLSHYRIIKSCKDKKI